MIFFGRNKRFAGRPHACLPTVSQQWARLVRLLTSMRPNTNSLHCSRQPLNALWYLASICSRTSHDRCCNSASKLRRLSFSIAMTAKLLRLIALISSNSGINRSRSTTNVCTNLNALVVRSSSMSLPMGWSFSASYMASSLALSLAHTWGETKTCRRDRKAKTCRCKNIKHAEMQKETTEKNMPDDKHAANMSETKTCRRDRKAKTCRCKNIKHAERNGKKTHAGW